MDRVHSSGCAVVIPTIGLSGTGAGQNRRRCPAVELNIGAALRKIREREGLTLADVAYRLGVTYQAVQRYEKGRARIALSTALDLCRSLDVPFARLVDLIAEATTTASPAQSGHGDDASRRNEPPNIQQEGVKG